MVVALVAAIIMHGGGKASLPGTQPERASHTTANNSWPEPAAAKPWKSSPLTPKQITDVGHATSTGNSDRTKPLVAARNAVPASTLPRRPRYLAGDYIEELRTRRRADAIAPANHSPGTQVPHAPTEFVLTPGMRFPAAIVASTGDATNDSRNDTTPAAAARAALESTFTAELAEALAHPDVAADPVLAAKAYDSAKARADARYKILFGDTAFNQMGMKAANEALQAE